MRLNSSSRTFGAIIQIAGLCGLFLLHSYAAKELGPELYGSLNVLIATVMVVSTLSMFGSSYYLPVKGSETDVDTLTTRFIIIAILISISVGLIVVALGLNRLNTLPLLIFGSLGISWLELLRTNLITSLNFVKASIFRYLLPLLGGFLIVAFFPARLDTFIIAFVGMPAFFGVFVLRRLKFNELKFRGLDKDVWIYFLMQASYLSYVHVLKLGQDIVVESRLIAIFSLAYMFVRFIMLIPNYLSLSYLPEFSSKVKNNDNEGVLAAYNHVITISFLVVINISLFVSENVDLIESFYGNEFAGLADALRVILILPVVVAVSGPNGPVILAQNNVKMELWNGVLLLILSFTLTIMIGNYFSNGIVWSLVIAETALVLRKRYQTYKTRGIGLINPKKLLCFAVYTGIIFCAYVLIGSLDIDRKLIVAIELVSLFLLIQIGYIIFTSKYEIIKF